MPRVSRWRPRVAVFVISLLVAGCGRTCGHEDAAPATATSASSDASPAASVDAVARARQDAGALPGEGPPPVSVGGRDVVEQPFAEVRGASYEVACERWLENERQAAEKYVELMGPFDELGAAACSPPVSTTSGHGAIVETAHAKWKTAHVGPGREHFDGEVLAFKTNAYVSMTNIRVGGRALTLNPVTDYKVLSEAWVGDDFLLDVEATTTTSYDGASPESMGEDAAGVDMGPWIRKETIHTVCNSRRLSCTTTVVR